MLTHVDVALQQEQLGESLNSLLQAFGLKTSTLLRNNVTIGKDIFSSYYKYWTRRMIETVYHRQLSMLEYEFDHINDDKLILPLSDSYQRKVGITR